METQICRACSHRLDVVYINANGVEKRPTTREEAHNGTARLHGETEWNSLAELPTHVVWLGSTAEQRWTAGHT
jgi:hypothetical protein